jgi:PhoD related phosphatase
MRTPVFLGIGKAAYKYYLLFQQHTPLSDVEKAPDPSFVLGKQPGPYIQSCSVSLCTTLGPRTVFFGLECRVERTRTRVCYESTYDAMFSRLNAQVIKGHTRHLILLLGVPIAYPRLVWLEGILGSRMITAPIKLSHKLFGVGGGLFNKFDGSSELLDDLNDHCMCSLCMDLVR